MSDSMASTSGLPRLHPWMLWAKWPRVPTNRRYHPVICHLIDVALVTRLLWARALTRMQRARVARELGLSEPDARRWCAFWAGLHDLGKASPAFQTQLAEKPDGPLIQLWLTDAGLMTQGAKWAPHGAHSLILLEEYLPSFGCNEQLAGQIAALVGAHHGLFFTTAQIDDLNRPELIGDDRWHELQRALMELLARVIELPSNAPQGQLSPGSAMTIAGLISVADWLGSDSKHFTLAADINLTPTPMDTHAYIQHAMQAAEKALTNAAWDAIDLSDSPASFHQIFPDKKPRAVQEAAIDLAHQFNGPGAVIIEVPTGEGKTEAAMYLADSWSVRLNQSGIYFALPTQATSNQMFTRVQNYLDQRFANHQFVNLHLAHGMAALSADYHRLAERTHVADASLYDQSASGYQIDPTQGAAIAAEWFAAPKRTLLSPYGVGTIDQALLAVLQVKHSFVRIFGLSGKTVIVDEIHAYDTYMSTLLVRLLQWLGAIGSPVVLLSATLPRVRRHKLLAAYAEGAGWPTPAIDEAGYPRITSLSQRGCVSLPITVTAKARALALQWINGTVPTDSDRAFPIATRLSAAMCSGGCVAIICNTVRRAQQVYRMLTNAFEQLPADQRPELDLLHSQLLHNDRLQREERILRAFGLGKDGKRSPVRPQRAVLVATQVIEQSLDLDFDLIISDLAPIDLLLQRAGRLHRHDVNDPYRPAELLQPTLYVCQPDVEEDGVPRFDTSDQYIYQPYILLRTWYELDTRIQAQKHPQIDIPRDVEPLIEAVYSVDESPPPSVSEAFTAYFYKTQRQAARDAQKAEAEAKQYRILPPWDDGLYTDFSRQLEEDNPSAHQAIQAHTRDGEPSLPVIVLDAHAAATLKRSVKPTLEQARALLGRSVNLSHAGVLRCLLSEPIPSGWAETPWLRNYRPIALNASGRAAFYSVKSGKTYQFMLDPVLGVIIETVRKE